MRRSIAVFSTLAVMSAVIVLPASAAPSYTLTGDSTEAGGHVTLVSDASPGFGGISFAFTGATFASLTNLATDFNVTDDNCAGGSPRFQIPIDTDNNGTSNGNMFIYLGPSPNFNNCPTNTWIPSGNLIGNNDACRFDTSQLAAGTQCNTYAGALAAFGTGTILGVRLIADAGWAFNDGEQTVKIDNVVINNDTYTFPPACTAVNNSGLVGYWRFNEGAGTTTADAAGGDNTGTLENGPDWVAGNPAIASNPSALRFDGSDDQVRTADSADFSFGTGSFTVSLFSKTATGSTSVLGNFNNTNVRGWGLYYYPNSVNFFAYGSGGTLDVPQGVPGLQDDNWHHVAGVFSRSGALMTIRTYVDGALVTTATGPVGDITSGSDLLLGHYLGQPNFDGTLDDIRVYNRALSASEITNLSNGCTTPASSSSSSMSSSVSSSSMSSSVSSSSVSSSSVSSSSSSSTGSVPMCNGEAATVYVQGGTIVGGPDDGETYSGTLRGTNDDDVIVGTSGSDTITGRDGADTVCGMGGADSIRGGDDEDWLDGGAGQDTIRGDDEEDIIRGGGEADMLIGNDNDDVLCGQGGNDTLEGGDNNDRLDGGAGTDTLRGQSNRDMCRQGETYNSCEQQNVAAFPECA